MVGRHRWPRMNRRTALAGAAGITVSLPFLESLDRPSPVSAQLRDGGPTRLFVFATGQGFSIVDSMPGSDFVLTPVLAPLDPVKDKLLVLSGFDNRVGGGGHNPTTRSQLSAMPSYGEDEYFQNIYSSGPSVDEVIATRIAAGGSRRRLDLADRQGSGPLEPVSSAFFWHGDADAVTHLTDPHAAFSRVFGGTAAGETLSAPEIERLRLRRRSVLDTVLGQFDGLRARVSVADRRRLDQHAEKIRELERSLAGISPLPTATLASCDARPTLPDVADPPSVVPEISRALIDIAVLATACGVSDVVTTQIFEGTYRWIGSALVDEEIAASENRYHIAYHKFSDGGDRGRPREAVNEVNRYLASLFARYLTGLEGIDEADGATALDRTLAIWVPEFGHGGGHASGNLLWALAGNLAGVPMGRAIRYGEATDSPWPTPTSPTTNQLLVSIFHAFGDGRDAFGDYTDPSIPRGPLPGL
jgi:hypothetical protein